ncbi:MAG: hypothetical protein ACQEW7_13930 [Pseudomonadota bacterium]
MASRIGRIGADNRSRFQWALVACLLSVAFLVLLNSVERVAADAEKQGVQLMLNQFRSALVVKGAEVMLADESLEDWQGSNPADLLDRLPPNWLGDCPEAGSGEELEEGTWCFEKDRGLVVFTPNWASFSPLNAEGEETSEPLAWRVEPEYTTTKTGNQRRATGLKLTRVKFSQNNLNAGRG